MTRHRLLHPRKIPFLFLALAVVVLDQWSKYLVEHHLPWGATEPVIPGLFNLVHVRNTGAAFGLFASGDGSATLMLTLFGILALVAVALYLRFTPPDARALLAALSLVAGGAVGNLLDRIAQGYVTDFLDVYAGSYHWPAFNVADSAISVGIGLMLVDTLLLHRRRTEADAGEPDADAGGTKGAKGTQGASDA